jgi:hypothetical protein
MSRARFLTRKLRESLENAFINDMGTGMGSGHSVNSFTCECGFQVADYVGAALVSCPKCGSIMNNDAESINQRDILKDELKSELKKELKPKESPEKTKENIKQELKKELKPKVSSEDVRDELLAEISKLKSEIEDLKSQQPQSEEPVSDEEPEQTEEPTEPEPSDTEQESTSDQSTKKDNSSDLDKDLENLATLVGEALETF